MSRRCGAGVQQSMWVPLGAESAYRVGSGEGLGLRLRGSGTQGGCMCNRTGRVQAVQSGCTQGQLQTGGRAAVRPAHPPHASAEEECWASGQDSSQNRLRARGGRQALLA